MWSLAPTKSSLIDGILVISHSRDEVCIKVENKLEKEGKTNFFFRESIIIPVFLKDIRNLENW